jgi:cytochrome b561
MQLKNTETHFGSITQLLHWIIAILVLVQYYLAYWTQWILPSKSPRAIFYINGLHKPIGIVILFLALIALFWRMVNTRPAFPTTMSTLEKRTAQLVHMLLTFCLFVMPISGFIMSTASGFPPNFFGLYQFPDFITPNKALSHWFFNIHSVTSILFIGLVGLHTLAALKHHFIDKDMVLKRMLPF